MNTRLDVLMARRDTEATAKSLGLTKATRFVNVLRVGVQDQSTTGEATYMQSVHRTAQIAINARSEVREAYSAYRTAHELARLYRDETVPLKKRISDENLLRYNGMLASVFELLADSRDQIAGVTGAVEALRDRWIAETDMQTALTGRSPKEQP